MGLDALLAEEEEAVEDEAAAAATVSGDNIRGSHCARQGQMDSIQVAGSAQTDTAADASFGLLLLRLMPLSSSSPPPPPSPRAIAPPFSPPSPFECKGAKFSHTAASISPPSSFPFKP